MKILSPNVENKEVEYIVKNHIFVKVMDYGRKYMLKQIYIRAGMSTWYWIDLRPSESIDMSRDFKVQSFDEAINRAVNNRYCSVYDFDTLDEMLNSWQQIIYKDDITTLYKSTDA